MTFVISAVALTILSLLIGGIVHGWLLAPDYMRLGALFRAEADAQAHLPYMILAHALIGIGATWIYRQGREAKPFLAQGVRFGLALTVLIVIPTYVIYFAVQPMPAQLVVKQIVFGTIGMLIFGIVAAWINQRDMPRVA